MTERTLDQALEDIQRAARKMGGTCLGAEANQMAAWLQELKNRRQAEKEAQTLFSKVAGPVTMPPYVEGSDTSKEAAESMKPKGPHLRRMVFQYLLSRGPSGATDDEVETALGLRHQTASARRRELVLAEKVEDSGERRRTSSGRSAAVWVVKQED